MDAYWPEENGSFVYFKTTRRDVYFDSSTYGDKISSYVQSLHHSHGIVDTRKLEMNNLAEQRQILRKWNW